MSGWSGPRVTLRKLTVADVSDAYVGWMNDAATNRYMETRWRAHSREDVEAFVAEKEESAVEHLYGIFLDGGSRHVGNLKIGPINPHHLYADISYFLGDGSVRGQGVGREAVGGGCALAFETHGVEKLSAGLYPENLASARVLQANGFTVEARRRGFLVLDGVRTDLVQYGLLKDEWRGR